MIGTGIVLLIVGAVIGAFVGGEFGRLGYFAAVVGLVLIVLGAVLGIPHR